MSLLNVGTMSLMKVEIISVDECWDTFSESWTMSLMRVGTMTLIRVGTRFLMKDGTMS